jgi:hypothetical protein
MEKRKKEAKSTNRSAQKCPEISEKKTKPRRSEFWFIIVIIYLDPAQECLQSWFSSRENKERSKQEGSRIRNLETILTPQKRRNKHQDVPGKRRRMETRQRHRWEFTNITKQNYDLLLEKGRRGKDGTFRWKDVAEVPEDHSSTARESTPRN